MTWWHISPQWTELNIPLTTTNAQNKFSRSSQTSPYLRSTSLYLPQTTGIIQWIYQLSFTKPEQFLDLKNNHAKQNAKIKQKNCVLEKHQPKPHPSARSGPSKYWGFQPTTGARPVRVPATGVRPAVTRPRPGRLQLTPAAASCQLRGVGCWMMLVSWY